MNWPISWWAFTGKMTEFDKDGISSPIYRNMKTQELASTWELPIGACFEVNPNHRVGRVGDDGKSIVCVLMNGHHWYIDGRASNCSNPTDDEHHCWVRHGTIGDAIHVDKNGNTCNAGAGSIAVEGWHGYLHNGMLKTV